MAWRSFLLGTKHKRQVLAKSLRLMTHKVLEEILEAWLLWLQKKRRAQVHRRALPARRRGLPCALPEAHARACTRACRRSCSGTRTGT